MKVQVLRTVDISDASDHSPLEKDNFYLATLNGFDETQSGYVIECYRHPGQPLDDPRYLDAIQNVEVMSYSIATLRQLIEVEI